MRFSPTTVSGNGNDLRSLRQRVERRLWRLWKSASPNAGRGLPRQHIFVAGVQRSGTNMLIELLAWSRWTDVYHETDPRAFANYEMLQDAIRALAARSSSPHFVIKSLCELDRISELMDEFAPAKAIWMLRRYDDTVNSAIRSFGNFAEQLHRLARDKGAAGWRGRGM